MTFDSPKSRRKDGFLGVGYFVQISDYSLTYELLFLFKDFDQHHHY